MAQFDHNRRIGVCALFARGFPRLRRVLALVALFSFAWQGYLIQTHIHGLTPAVVAGIPAQGDPAPGDADHCLLCQEAIVAGSFLVPAPVLVPTYVPAVAAAPQPVTAALAAEAPSHHWRGRGPPYRA